MGSVGNEQVIGVSFNGQWASGHLYPAYVVPITLLGETPKYYL